MGDAILHTGLYEVVHSGHRVNHFVVLLAGQTFPRCARCGDHVQFHLLEAASDTRDDPEFRVHLYEIPHPASPVPDKEKDGEAA